MLAYGLVLRQLYDRFVVNGRTVIGLCLFVPIFMTFALTLERNLSAIVGEAGLLLVALSAVLFCVTSRPPVGSAGFGEYSEVILTSTTASLTSTLPRICSTWLIPES